MGASITLLALTPAAIARADNVDDPLNALMMGGTAMPTPSEFWRDTIITDYIDPATGAELHPGVGAHPGIGCQHVDSGWSGEICRPPWTSSRSVSRT